MRWTALSVFSIALLTLNTRSATAQSLTDSSKVLTAYIFAGIEGFIPTRQAYRLNYSTSLAGLPIEVSGGVMFPITPDVLTPLTLRYIHRKANFIANTTISVVSIEPGVRIFLEKQRQKDIRIFAGADVLIAQANVTSTTDVSADGAITGTQQAAKNYVDLGIGLDLGFAYPLTATSSLDALVHGAYYLSSSVSRGGIGNIGGISIGAIYRYGF